MHRHLTIDFGKIHDTAIKGINRAAVFMGLGVNAADMDDLDNYLLDRDTRFRILPEEVSAETIKGWKQEFRIWVVGCGFRELVDRFCVFMDRLYHACSIVSRSSTPKIQKEFEDLGMDRKIKKINEEFAVSCHYDEHLSTFYPIRNCFVHRLGLVGPRDLKSDKTLNLRWMRFQTVFTTQYGHEQQIPDFLDPKSPSFVTREGGFLGLKWVSAERKFEKGDWIRLNPKELTEILFFARLCAVEYTKSGVGFAKDKGILLKNNAEQSTPADG